jgi:Cu(I)/Ag(I) efflux system membrane fusion protein
MRKIWLAILVGVSLAVVFLLGSMYRQKTDAKTAGIPLYYRDAMNPSYTSDKPGKAPDGMDLQPVYADQGSPTPSAMPMTSPGVVQLSRERQQMIGVQLGRVQKSPATQTLRTVGRVVLDENRLFPLTAAGDGWVTRILSDSATGDTVREGQPLISVYGRDYMTAQRTFLYALAASKNPPPVASGDIQNLPAFTLQEARLVLQNMGFGVAQIEQISRTNQLMLDITLTAPATGVIISRNAWPKQEFSLGTELFRVADLTHVWIDADLFGSDAGSVQTGTAARVSVPGRPGIQLRATVSKSLPRFDAGSRTLKLRLEVQNPELILRPDMFVDLEFPINLPAATTVPVDAVVESGLRKIVFVDKGSGVFEPRAVETGWRSGGLVQIIHGLDPGESIVVSGNFLLDSERKIRQGDAGGHD